MPTKKKQEYKPTDPLSFYDFQAIKIAFSRGVLTPKEALGQFLIHTVPMPKATEVVESWAYMLKEIFPLLEEKDFEDFRYVSKPWGVLPTKTKKEFVKKYFAPLLELPLEEILELLKEIVQENDTAEDEEVE